MAEKVKKVQENKLIGEELTVIHRETGADCVVFDDSETLQKKQQDLTGRIEALEEKTSKRYVVRWDKKKAVCERCYDAAGISADTEHFAYHGSVDELYDNPFDKLYPWSHRKLCKVDKSKYKELYESSGDVLEAITKWEDEPDFKLGPELAGMDMVYTPEFWMRQWEDGEYVYYGVADGPIDGWVYVHPMVTGRYLASKDNDGNLTSIAGSVPRSGTDVSVKSLHDAAKKDSLTLDNIFTWCAETMLMVVEFANLNCQTAIGQGVCSNYNGNSNSHPVEDGTETNEILLPATFKDFAFAGAMLGFNSVNDNYTLGQRVITKVEAQEGGNIKATFDGEPMTFTTETFVGIFGLGNLADEKIGSKSGYIGTNGKSHAYYRGRCCYGQAYHYLLGVYREQNTGHIWAARDEDTADELDGLDKEKCVDTGCALPQKDDGAAVGEGYIQELHLLPDYPCAPFAKSVGGSSADPVGDYCWWPALNTSDTICLAGAGANNGLGVGRFTAGWRNPSSSAWWHNAASLAFKFPKGGA